MEKQRRNILIGTGIAAAGTVAAVGATRAVTAGLVDFALDRQPPAPLRRLRTKMTRRVMESDNWSRVQEAGRRLEASEHRWIEITSRDEQLLVGHLRGCQEAKRVLLAMHGWRSNWYNDFGIISDFWQEQGCAVLYAEQRGQNDSGGDYMGMGLLEQYDAADWAEYLAEEFGGGMPIYLAGVSMGATTVMLAAGLDLPKNVRGIMADCGFTSVNEIWRHFAEDALHISYDRREKQAVRLCEKKLGMDTEAHVTTEVLKNCRLPIFFAHGGQDKVVPVEMTIRNFEAAHGPKHLLIVPKAGHGECYLADTENYQELTKCFFELYDDPEKE